MTGDPAVRVRAWLDAPTWLPDAADDLRAVLAELLDYRNAITWETICLSCSRMLDACRAADERAEAAEADLESVGQMLIRAMDGWTEEATPLHDHLGRIRLAAWDPHVDGNAFRELVRAVVGHPLTSREDATAAAASIRAECRRIGIPVTDTAEEKVQRVRERPCPARREVLRGLRHRPRRAGGDPAEDRMPYQPALRLPRLVPPL